MFIISFLSISFEEICANSSLLVIIVVTVDNQFFAKQGISILN